MTAVAEAPAADPQVPKRRRGLLAGVGVMLLALAGLVAASTVTPTRSDALASRFLYVHDGQYQAWLSMDGKHDGKIMTDPSDTGQDTVVPGCVNGEANGPGPDLTLHTEPCSVQPANFPDAPTTPEGWRAYFMRRDAGTELLAKDVGNEAEFHYLSAQSRAALLSPFVLPMPREQVTSEQDNVTGMVDARGNFYFAWDPKTMELMHQDGPNYWHHVTQIVVDQVGDTN